MSFVRTNTANSSHLVSCDGARTTHWQTPRSGNSVLEIQTYPDSSKVTKAQRAQLGRNTQKIARAVIPLYNGIDVNSDPPVHFHWYQEEYFTVTQGCVIYHLTYAPESVIAKRRSIVKAVQLPLSLTERSWAITDSNTWEACSDTHDRN